MKQILGQKVKGQGNHGRKTRRYYWSSILFQSRICAINECV